MTLLFSPVPYEQLTLEQACARVNTLSDLEFHQLAVAVLFDAATYGTIAYSSEVGGKRTLTPNSLRYIAVGRRIARTWGLELLTHEAEIAQVLAGPTKHSTSLTGDPK